MRGFTTAAVTIGLCALGTTATPPAVADVRCSDQRGPNPGNVESYRAQYSSAVSEPLKSDLSAYHSVAASDNPTRTGRAATTTLYSEIQTDQAMFTDQTWFGCYDSAVLTRLTVEHSQISYPVGHMSTMPWLGVRAGDVHLAISSPGWAKHAWSCFFPHPPYGGC